jgi:hypothetical protein
MLPLSERKKIIAQVPWIDVIPPDARCDALRWSEVPLRTLYRWGPKQANPPTGTERYRCKLRARYRFHTLEDSWPDDGDYCLLHVTHLMFIDLDENDRFTRWYEKYKQQARHGDTRDA